MGTAVLNAATKTSNYVTTTFVTDIKSESCVTTINKKISSLGKIENYEINLKTKEAIITYNSKKNSDDKIIAGFSKLGFKATVKQEVKSNSNNTSNTSNNNSSSNNSNNSNSNNNNNSSNKQK